jgi:uncharacterized protein YcgI (DUF1989 family)
MVAAPMRLRLRMNDQQLAVLDGALAADPNASSLDDLLARAVEHDVRRPQDSRWRTQRPAGRPPSVAGVDVRIDDVIEAGTGRGVDLAAGETVRIEQIVDGQCVDLCAVAIGADGQRFDASRTRALHGLRPTTAAVLWSTPPEIALLEIVADSAGPHDLSFPACSAAEFERLTGIAGHSNCVDIQRETRRYWGIDERDQHDPLNLWLPSGVTDDGTLIYWPVACRRGDFVELRALRDVLVVVNPCASDLFGSSLYELGPVRLLVRTPPGVVPLGLAPEGPDPHWRWHDMPLREIEVALPDTLAPHLATLRAGGWLGDTDAEVARALLLRWWEDAIAQLGGIAR